MDEKLYYVMGRALSREILTIKYTWMETKLRLWA